MSHYDPQDKYYKRAKNEGYVSRAAYKLIEIDQKYKLFKPGMTVVDLGCAPGGWIQVAADLIEPSGRIFGIDLDPISRNFGEGVTTIQGDLEDEATCGQICALAFDADLVLSDMAPKTTGVKFVDQVRSTELAHIAFELACQLLKPSGCFVVKIFPGSEFAQFKKKVSQKFNRTVQFIPAASRKGSIETYLIGIGFK